MVTQSKFRTRKIAKQAIQYSKRNINGKITIVKKGAAYANYTSGKLQKELYESISKACDRLIAGELTSLYGERLSRAFPHWLTCMP